MIFINGKFNFSSFNFKVIIRSQKIPTGTHFIHFLQLEALQLSKSVVHPAQISSQHISMYYLHMPKFKALTLTFKMSEAHKNATWGLFPTFPHILLCNLETVSLASLKMY